MDEATMTATGGGAERGGEVVGGLSELNLYPVKSMKGLAVPSWPVGPTGLLGDRRWMVVDARGRQVTQRELPRLCLVAPRLSAAPGSAGQPDVWDLTLTAPAAGSVVASASFDGLTTRARVWDDEVDAVGVEPEVDRWLSRVLGREVRLVRFGRAAAVAGRDWQRVGFRDSLPFLLIGRASLADLNLRLGARGEAPVEMNRFRPNLVVAGPAAFAEDGWRRISIGEVSFTVRKACGRCVITTVDQATAAVGREPLRTLATYRTSRDGKVMFGQKLVHDPVGSNLGELRVGDSVRVLEALPAAEGLRFRTPVRRRPRPSL